MGSGLAGLGGVSLGAAYFAVLTWAFFSGCLVFVKALVEMVEGVVVTVVCEMVVVWVLPEGSTSKCWQKRDEQHVRVVMVVG